jgi:Activator of Hsp90 ATPase homolog 1-like protein
VSHCRQQAFVDAPPQVVWNLLSDIDRHDEWWAGMVEVDCDGLEAGCTYRQVNVNPFGRDQENTLTVDELEDCEELSIHCLDTGTFVRFVLTEAQGGTFVDGEAGMEPAKIPHRIWDTLAGKRWYRDWLAKSLDGIAAAAKRNSGDSARPGEGQAGRAAPAAGANTGPSA